MKNEFVLAFNQVLEEKQLPKQVILEALEAAMASAYRKTVGLGDMQHVRARVNPDTGEVTILLEKEVVETVNDERTEISLEEARKINKNAELGGIVVVETVPKNVDFGRVAAQNARNVIQQRIRDAERKAQIEYFEKQVGEIINGVVQSVTNGNVILALEMGAEGILARKDQIPGERFRTSERVRALLVEVKPSQKGNQIILSRAHKNFLRRLLEIEVPEIYHGIVEIRSIAREPGYRSKVAVAALKPGIDPVGACVGIRGVRIQAIVRELHDEKIDVIEWSQDPKVYIAKTLSPARVLGVYLDEYARGPKTATVVVPEDQLSLAIGKDGQNARLSAKLTGWRIDIKGQLEAASDILFKLQNDPDYMQIADRVQEFIPQVEAILKKKEEGRPVTPEEYQLLNRFIDRTETSVIEKHQEARRAKEEIQVDKVVPEYYALSIEELRINERIQEVLAENGYTTIGELIQQMETNADEILKLNGIGPKAMTEIKTCIETLIRAYEEKQAPLADQPESADVALESSASAEEAEERRDVRQIEAQIEPLAEEAPMPRTELEGEGEVETSEEINQLTSQESLSLFEKDMEDMISIERWKDDEEEDFDDYINKDKKKKKKKYVEMEYDPDQGIMIVKRKRKRIGDWEHSDW
jgi:N utilization substance protein A